LYSTASECSSLAAGARRRRSRFPAQLLDVPGCGALLVAQRGQQSRIAAEAGLHAGRLPDRLCLIQRHSGTRQLAGIDAVQGTQIQRLGQQAERAGLPGQRHAAGGEDVEPGAVPQEAGGGGGCLERRDVLISADGRGYERADGLGQDVDPVGEPLGDEHAVAVQQQPGGIRRLGQGQRPQPPPRLQHVAGEAGCPHRVDVSRPGQVPVQRVEPLRGPQQLHRAVTAVGADEDDLRPQPPGLGPAQLVQRPGLGHLHQLHRPIVPAGLVPGLRRGQRPRRAPLRVQRQRGRALQERRRRGHPATGPGQPGGVLQLAGHLLIGPRRGLRPVPGPPARIGGRIGRRRQHAVRGPPLLC